MPQRQFLISASGYIYECTQGSLRDCQPGGKGTRLLEHGRHVPLGRISCLAREETPLGREVRAWWQARLASDEPVENIVALDRNDPCLVRTSEDTIKSPPEQGMSRASF